VTAWAKLVIGLVVATVVGVIGATVLVASKVREETVVEHPYEEGLKHTERQPAACDLGAGPCTAPLEGGGEVTLEIGPRPIRTMTELTVRATWREPPPRVIRPELRMQSQVDLLETTVAFSMPGMEMGTNRVVLHPVLETEDALEGKAVLVRCASGRRDWIVTVTEAVKGEAGAGTLARIPRVARFRLTAVE
jgi:hypothetical protein